MKNHKSYLSVVLLIHLAAIVLLGFLIRHHHRAYQDIYSGQVLLQQELLAKETSLAVARTLESLSREVVLLAEKVGTGPVDSPQSRQTALETFSFTKKFHANDAALLDASGVVRYAVAAPQLEGQDFAFRRYFREASEAVAPTSVYEVIEFRGVDAGERGIIVAAPVFDPGARFVGVALLTVKIRDLLAASTPPPSHLYEASVVDGQGRILFHRDHPPGTRLEELNYADLTFARFLQRTRERAPYHGEYVAADGSSVLASAHPISVADHNWSVIIATRKSAANQLLADFTLDYVLLTGLSLLLLLTGSVAVFLALSRWNRMLAVAVAEKTRELEQSQSTHRILLETIRDCVWEVDRDCTFVYVSPRATEILGYQPRELLGRPMDCLMPGGLFQETKSAICGDCARPGGVTSVVFDTTTKAGEFLALETSLAPILGDDGGFQGCRGVFRDVTDRRQSERALQESEEKYRSLVETMNDGILVEDDGGAIVYANRRLGEFLGFEPDSLLSKRLEDLVHPESQVALREHRDFLGGGLSDVRELTWSGRDDARLVAIIASVPGNPTGNGRSPGFSVVTDITKRKLSEEELRRRKDQLQSLASELSRVEEEERRRFASELHDCVSQPLAVARIRLGMLQESLDGTDEKSLVQEVRATLKQAIRELSTLTFEISPPVLHELGLPSAIAWTAQELGEAHGITFTCDVRGEYQEQERDLEVFLYRSARELMTNAVKHARARSVRVTISDAETGIRITVEDDGGGFRPPSLGSHMPASGGFGLLSIRERLDLLGGELQIDSQPGKGSRVSLCLPGREGRA